MKKEIFQKEPEHGSYLGTFPHHLAGKQSVVEERLVLRQEGGVAEEPTVSEAFLLQFLVLLVFEEVQSRPHGVQLFLERRKIVVFGGRRISRSFKEDSRLGNRQSFQ